MSPSILEDHVEWSFVKNAPIYELRKLASARLAKEKPGQTLNRSYGTLVAVLDADEQLHSARAVAETEPAIKVIAERRLVKLSRLARCRTMAAH